MRSRLLHESDPRDVHRAHVLTIVLVVVFAGWIAAFGVAAPWDITAGVDAGEFFGRFFGLLLVLALVLSPLAIAAIGGRRRT